MLASAKTQTGIQNYNRLAGLGLALDPTWFEQQRVADGQWLEMPLPAFGPILAADSFQAQPGWTGAQAKGLQPHHGPLPGALNFGEGMGPGLGEN